MIADDYCNYSIYTVTYLVSNLFSTGNLSLLPFRISSKVSTVVMNEQLEIVFQSVVKSGH